MATFHKQVLTTTFRFATLMSSAALVTACLGDPPLSEPDGALVVYNDSADPIVLASGYGDKPNLDELFENTWAPDVTPPNASVSMNTFQGDDPDQWCLNSRELIVVLKHVNGVAPDGTRREYSPENFEILTFYGPEICVNSKEGEIRYTS